MTKRNDTVRAFSARDPEIARAGQAIMEGAVSLDQQAGQGERHQGYESRARVPTTVARWAYATGAALFLGLASLASEDFQLVACTAAFVFFLLALAKHSKP